MLDAPQDCEIIAFQRLYGAAPTGIASFVSDDSADLGKIFSRLARKWKEACGHVASINKWAQTPEYQKIIALGRNRPTEMVRILLAELERSPDHWFWALKEITGVNPVTQESRGSVNLMAKCWLEWGKRQGYC
jgi:hypothetical protein